MSKTGRLCYKCEYYQSSFFGEEGCRKNNKYFLEDDCPNFKEDDLYD